LAKGLNESARYGSTYELGIVLIRDFAGGKRSEAMFKYAYDIHNILTVVSEVRLPELAKFRTEDDIGEPSIRVRIDEKPGHGKRKGSCPDSDSTRMIYDESLGPIGFSVYIELGDIVEVAARPVLQRSPHVLYTNVVEPILRWRFVEKGYALVHGACLAFTKDAYLITAKTDTGKTTTVLRILNRQRRATDTAAFLSDDLTLMSPDGRVLAYPKPLTISSHTISSIDAQDLDLHQRLGLIIQSHVHSRNARRFALLLARTNLPMATINTWVQWLIPPPKYHVEQLVPRVKLARNAKLAGMFVIQRGRRSVRSLNHDEAVDILMDNSADAFGFPPYPAIERFLSNGNGKDLRASERQMISAALERCPTTVLSREDLEWWRQIPAFVDDEIAVHFSEPLGEALSIGVRT
jgi:hypothetical protein